MYSLSNLHQTIVTVCTEDKGQGHCYPLYGFEGSGKIPALTVSGTSWDPLKKGYTSYTPGSTNQLMIDNSLQYYKSLYIILNDNKNYPEVCWVDSKSLKQVTSDTKITITWPDNGIPQPCQLN